MFARPTLCPLTAFLLAGVPAEAQSLVLNEILAREEGIDRREFVELRGTPGVSLDGVVLLAVDGAAASAGLLDLALDLSGHAMPGDGLFLVASTDVPGQDLVVSGTNWLRNRTQTLYLVHSTDVQVLLAQLGSDLDPDGDGETVLPTLATILDHVALVDFEWVAGQAVVFDEATVRGTEGGTIPSGIFRSADNGNWCTEFLAYGATNQHHPRTPGSANGNCVWGQRTLRGQIDPFPLTVDEFGADVDVTDDGTALLVGSPYDRAVQELTGSVHVLDLLTGERMRLLTLAQPPVWGGFGGRLDSSGDRALISSPNTVITGVVSGAAYLFNWRTGQELAQLDPPFPASTDGFGWDLAIDGDFAIVGNRPETNAVGAAWVYDAPTGTLLHELAPPDPAPGMGFGMAVGVHDGLVLVGAPWDDGVATRSGSAYLFDAASGAFVRKLLPQPGQEYGWFGAGVDLNEDHIVASAPFEDDGRVHTFERATGVWTGTLDSPHPFAGLKRDGRALELDGDRVLVGVEDGLGALLFDLDAPSQPQILTPAGYWQDVGVSVALAPTSAFLGAPGAWYKEGQQGAVIELETTVGVPYCMASPSSIGVPATISARGYASLAAEVLVLRAEPVPASQPGFFFYGSVAANVPFGAGTLCAGGLLGRPPVEVSSAGEELVHVLDTSAPPSALVAIEPYSTWYFQAWFRDPAGTGSQLSNGLEVTFRP